MSKRWRTAAGLRSNAKAALTDSTDVTRIYSA